MEDMFFIILILPIYHFIYFVFLFWFLNHKSEVNSKMMCDPKEVIDISQQILENYNEIKILYYINFIISRPGT